MFQALRHVEAHSEYVHMVSWQLHSVSRHNAPHCGGPPQCTCGDVQKAIAAGQIPTSIRNSTDQGHHPNQCTAEMSCCSAGCVTPAGDIQRAITEGQIPTSVKDSTVKEAAQLVGPALYYLYTGCMWRCVNYALKNWKTIACEKECARNPYKTW